MPGPEGYVIPVAGMTPLTRRPQAGIWCSPSQVLGERRCGDPGRVRRRAAGRAARGQPSPAVGEVGGAVPGTTVLLAALSRILMPTPCSRCARVGPARDDVFTAALTAASSWSRHDDPEPGRTCPRRSGRPSPDRTDYLANHAGP